MAITRSDVAKVASLARLELSNVELDTMTRDLQGIVGFISSLDELDTSGVAHPLGTQNVFREDIPTDSLSLSEALQSAPRHDGKYFLVPAVLGETGSA